MFLQGPHAVARQWVPKIHSVRFQIFERHPSPPQTLPSAANRHAYLGILTFAVRTLSAGFSSGTRIGTRRGGDFKVVGQVDNTDLLDGHLRVGQVLP